MKTSVKFLAALTVLSSLLFGLASCGCGFDCSSDNDKAPALLSLGFSDEALEQLKQVVIEVDSITFRRSGAEDVVVDSFTIEAQDLAGADSFQIDLLQYQGLNQLLVITDLELEAATYSSLRVSILDDDINHSYVQESDDSLRPITVAGGVLSLPGPTLSSGQESFTVAFSLAQALQFQSSADEYLLANEGIRLVDNAVAASISGRIDNSLFDSVTPCDAKSDPESGNRVYLYSGTGLAADELADVFTASSSTDVPDTARAPYAVASLAEDTLTGGWLYALGYIDAGSYSLAFSCDAADDDPVDYDGISIPLPADQVYELELSEGERATCDLADGAACEET